MRSKNMQNNKWCHQMHEHLKCNTCSFTSNMAGAEPAIFLIGSFIFCLFEMGLNLLINLVKWGEKVVFEVDGGLGDLESISCDFVNVQIRSTNPDCKQLLGQRPQSRSKSLLYSIYFGPLGANVLWHCQLCSNHCSNHWSWNCMPG